MSIVANPGSQPVILVVDDDVVLRMTAGAYLENSALDYVEAVDGSSGLEVFKSTRPDLMLVDVEMPGMNGFELCAAVRALPEGRHVPIVMATGREDVDSVRRAYDAGATDFATKPVNYPILIHRIHYILRNQRLADELRASEASLASANRIARIGHWNYEITAIPGHRQIACSNRTRSLLGWAQDEPQSLDDLLGSAHPDDRACLDGAIDAAISENTSADFECRFIGAEGSTTVVRHWLEVETDSDGSAIRVNGTIQDLTDRKRLEGQLIQARKLESIGQLAAGISHEINTPIQYISDNIRFLQGAFGSILGIEKEYAKLLDCSANGLAANEQANKIASLQDEADHSYLLEEIPQAISQCLDGTGHVAEIVSAMKEFAHPGSTKKEPADLNALISNAITVSRGEWKYVADVRTDLQEGLAPVPLHPSEFGQAMINLIINAAHAIDDASSEGNDERGTIEIVTRQSGNTVEIHVKDTGCGIPDNTADKIFDPFFTTKDVGKGTGQGLAIARSTIVDKHAGDISVQSTVSRGTTFTITLPLDSTQREGLRSRELAAVAG